jgi:hypothetical protein
MAFASGTACTSTAIASIAIREKQYRAAAGPGNISGLAVAVFRLG